MAKGHLSFSAGFRLGMKVQHTRSTSLLVVTNITNYQLAIINSFTYPIRIVLSSNICETY